MEEKFNAREWVPDSNELLDCLAGGLGNLNGLDGPVSDYRLAQVLEISKASISEIRRGKTTLGAPTCKKVADIMTVPYEWVLACIEAERARRAQNVDLEKTWKIAAGKLVMCLIAGVILYQFPLHQAQAGEIYPVYTLCALLSSWRPRLKDRLPRR